MKYLNRLKTYFIARKSARLPKGLSLVLAYHNVNNCAIVGTDLYTVTTHNFHDQMQMLKKYFNVIPVKELFQDNVSDKPKILITFDDGEKNNFTEAFPVLQLLKLPALFFVKTDFIGKPGYMTEDDIRYVSNHGITIGSHSHTHCDFGKISMQQAENELTVSKNILEKLISEEITVFAYPYGNLHNIIPSDKEILKKIGFTHAFIYSINNKTHSGDPYRIQRMMVVDVLAHTLFSQIVSTLRNQRGF